MGAVSGGSPCVGDVSPALQSLGIPVTFIKFRDLCSLSSELAEILPSI